MEPQTLPFCKGIHTKNKIFNLYLGVESDVVDCWEFKFTYQQIESTTMSQYEFDMINTIDEKARKKLKEGDKGDFLNFFYYNKKRLKSLHPNTD